MTDKAKTTATAGGWVDDRKGESEFEKWWNGPGSTASEILEDEMDAAHIGFLAGLAIGQAAQKKRDASEARKFPAFGIGENIAKAIEGDET